MRHILVLILVLTAMSLAVMPALLQAQTTREPGDILQPVPPVITEGGPGQKRMVEEMEGLIGSAAIARNGREVGEVENLLVDTDGEVEAVVVEWGGVLGIGERRVAVPVSEVALSQDGERAIINWTREQFEAARQYDPDTPAASGVDPDIKPLLGYQGGEARSPLGEGRSR